ncbi:MAG: hypothetical protein D6798_05675 [Deltaproteobacteria bacterium]|nr:MAG: hypothetical protein D6798_05675 [Deltaproteobacteria bacterium]
MFLALLALVSTAHAGPRAEFAPRKPAPPEVRFGAWLQPRLTWQQGDDAVGTTSGVAFSLRRARVSTDATWLTRTDPAAIDGWRGPSLVARIDVELAADPHLAEGYVDLRAGHPLQLRVGRFPVPGAHDRAVADDRLLLPDRSLATRAGPGRDTGAAVHGFVGRHVLAWDVGVFNGEGAANGNPDGGLRVAGRVEVSPLGGIGEHRDLLRPDWRLLGHRGVPIGTYNPMATLTIGVFGWHGEAGSAAEERAGADLFLHWRPFNLVAGATLGRVLDEDGAVASTQGGYTVQAALFPPGAPWAWDHLALLARIDAFDPDLDAVAAASDADAARREITVGAKVLAGRPLFAGMDDATLLVAWILRQEPEPQARTTGYADDMLLVSAQLGW